MNADADYNAVMNGDLTDGSIMLMHDIHEPSVQAAVRLIPDLIEKGYKLMTVSELAQAKGVDLQYVSYNNFWDSTLGRGEVPGYEGNTSSGDGSEEGGDGSDISDGSGEEESFDDGSGDYSDGTDGSSDDGSEDYSDGTDEYSDDGSGDYGDGTDEYSDDGSGEY